MAGRIQKFMPSISRTYEEAAVLLLVLMALLARLPGIADPPLDFHPTRQYRSAILARALYYEGNPAIPEWKRELAAVHAQGQGAGEPLVMETLAAWSYRLAGGERLVFAHLIATIFWMGSGLAVFLWVRTFGSSAGALVALAYVLFVPFGIVAGRSFQPESLMIFCLTLTLVALARLAVRPHLYSLGAAVLAGSLAGLVKPSGLFFVAAPTVAVLAFSELPLKGPQTLFRRGALVAGSVACLAIPALAYYGYKIWITGSMAHQLQGRFVPTLLGSGFFWSNWPAQVGRVTGGLPFVCLGVLGAVTAVPGQARALASGLWLGYAVFAVISNYHVATHDYYSLPLVVIVGLSLGLLVTRLSSWLSWLAAPSGWLACVAVVAIGSLLGFRAALPELTSARRSVTARQYEVLGKKVGHARDLVILGRSYGFAEGYHGLVAGTTWPGSADLWVEKLNGNEPLPAAERFERYYAGGNPSYFVVTDLGQLQEQPDLTEFLAARARLVAEDIDYRVYELRRAAVDVRAGGP